MDHPSAEEAKIILNSITDGVFTVDAHRVITYFNRAAEQITGISQFRGRRTILLGGLPGQHLPPMLFAASNP